MLDKTELKIEILRTQYFLQIKLLGIHFSPTAAAAVYSTSTKLQRRQHKTTYRLIVIQLLVFPKCVVGVSVCFQCCCFGANVEFVYALMRHQFLCPPTRVCLIWMRRVSPTFPSEYCRVCLSRLFAQNSNRQPDINNNH